MKERWIVRLLVDRDPDHDEPPTCWDWDIADANVVVMSGEIVGVLAPEPNTHRVRWVSQHDAVGKHRGQGRPRG